MMKSTHKEKNLLRELILIEKGDNIENGRVASSENAFIHLEKVISALSLRPDFTSNLGPISRRS